jgi:hypothetical protein
VVIKQSPARDPIEVEVECPRVLHESESPGTEAEDEHTDDHQRDHP